MDTALSAAPIFYIMESKLAKGDGEVEKQPTQTTYALTGCNWELTLGCTLSCMHCGSRAGKARPNELDLTECLGVADQLVEMGCKEVTLIGGEVFLYKGWEILSAHLSDRGMGVNLVSNGYQIGPRQIDQLQRSKVINIGISIDGMEANHNRVRGRKDAFSRLKDTLSLLNKAAIPVGAVTSLMKFNCSDLEALYNFLCENGVGTWQIQLASAMGNLAGRRELAVSRDQVQEIIRFIRAKNQDRRMVLIAADSIGYFDENETYIRGVTSPFNCWGGCAAGVSGIFIDSVGNVKGCGALYSDAFIEGNLRQSTLAEIWNNPANFAYNRSFKTEMLEGSCKGCEAGEICRGGCRSSNYFATDSLYANAFCVRGVA